MAHRYDQPGRPFDGLTRMTPYGPRWTGRLRLVHEHLLDPFSWGEPRKVFVNSMSDLFHEDIPTAFISKVVNVMSTADWHIYQVLTKRARRMAELLRTRLCSAAGRPHIWWGVTVESKAALRRIDELRSAPAAVRFLSIEPLLEDLGTVNLEGISWVIVGGESGPKARPIQADWVRSLLYQCRGAGIPFFFKQWGGRRKRLAGCLLDRLEYKEYPSFVAPAAPPRTERRKLVAMCQEALSLTELG